MVRLHYFRVTISVSGRRLCLARLGGVFRMFKRGLSRQGVRCRRRRILMLRLMSSVSGRRLIGRMVGAWSIGPRRRRRLVRVGRV